MFNTDATISAAALEVQRQVGAVHALHGSACGLPNNNESDADFKRRALQSITQYSPSHRGFDFSDAQASIVDGLLPIVIAGAQAHFKRREGPLRSCVELDSVGRRNHQIFRRRKRVLAGI